MKVRTEYIRIIKTEYIRIIKTEYIRIIKNAAEMFCGIFYCNHYFLLIVTIFS